MAVCNAVTLGEDKKKAQLLSIVKTVRAAEILVLGKNGRIVDKLEWCVTWEQRSRARKNPEEQSENPKI